MNAPSVSFPGISAPYDNLQATRDGRRSMPLYVDVDLTSARSSAAGTALILPIAGNSFYVDANPTDGNAIVHFQDMNTDKVSVPFYVCPGFIAKVPFTFISVENAAQTGKKIRIVYGIDQDFTANTTSQIGISGVVSIVDGGKARTQTNVAFMAGTTISGVAAQFTAIQLWNPVGTGRNLIVSQVEFSHSIAGLVDIGKSSAQLTSLAAVSAPVNKNFSSGVASVAEIRYRNNAALPVGLANVGYSSLIAANTPNTYKTTEQISIPPGYGITVQSEIVNDTLGAYFEYFEELI